MSTFGSFSVCFKVHKPMDPSGEEIVSLRLRSGAISSKTERNSLLSVESELSCSHTECAQPVST